LSTFPSFSTYANLNSMSSRGRINFPSAPL
jgi:hypothetical protein